MPTPTRKQVAVTRSVVEWYRETHHNGPGDIGLIGTFCQQESVGHFAAERAALENGDDDALFRLLVTVAMFQRLRDALVMKILRAVPERDALELCSATSLARLAESCACPHARSNFALLSVCDLRKNQQKQGACDAEPEIPCRLKRHTVLLRRYGHFGKMPTSAALVVTEMGGSMTSLRQRVYAATLDPLARAQGLECALSQVWRVSEKIGSMYLSLVTAPNMGLSQPPWRDGVDWTWFVVVDRNVDLFLASIGYDGFGTYSARRTFVRELASRIDLREIDPGLPSFHPRFVQQAMYLFMSSSNRRRAPSDCSHLGIPACIQCPAARREHCPLLSRRDPAT